jgi:hypothetical protein
MKPKGGAMKPEKKAIEAQEFILKDATGKVRATLAASDDGPGLTLFDAKGQRRIALHIIRGQAALVLFDGEGKYRAQLDVGEDGPSLYLFDCQGNPRAILAPGTNSTGLLLIDGGRNVVYHAP